MILISISISILLLLTTLSCNENDCCSEIPGNDIIYEFSILDNSDRDLLNSEISVSFNTTDIRLYNYNEIKGDTTMIYNGNSDAPYGYVIIERDSIFRLRPFFDTSDKLEVKGYIKWNSQDIDTVELKLVQQSTNIKRLTKIFYNGSEVWNEETSSNPEYRYFQIIK